MLLLLFCCCCCCCCCWSWLSKKKRNQQVNKSYQVGEAQQVSSNKRSHRNCFHWDMTTCKEFPKKLTSVDVRGQLMRSNSCRSSTTLQWSLQNRAHWAHGPVGVETGLVGKLTTGHKCARLEIWVAYPGISGCPPHTAYFSSNFPASSFPRGFHLCTGSVDLQSRRPLGYAAWVESLVNSSGLSSSEEHKISLLVPNAIHFNYVLVREGGFYTWQAWCLGVWLEVVREQENSNVHRLMETKSCSRFNETFSWIMSLQAWSRHPALLISTIRQSPSSSLQGWIYIAGTRMMSSFWNKCHLLIGTTGQYSKSLDFTGIVSKTH